jgi:serine/threonine-protein kinase PknK
MSGSGDGSGVLPSLPARWAPIRRLGAGGGGEVWSVRDRIDGRTLALKALSAASGESTQQELAALVREATTLLDLSASTGMALPRVHRFGRLSDRRPYLVRDMVEGESLAALLERGAPLVDAARALLAAATQLTQLHRAGLLHGDVKPANLIVTPDGGATLVDLGLATAWGPAGARPEGLTPRFAAPELFEGEPLTVRGEVYAFGATLRDVLASCDRTGVATEAEAALEAVERRATARDPSARQPSIDELGAGIASAFGFALAPSSGRGIWTIAGIDGPLSELIRAVEALGRGEELAVVGPPGAGARTLLAALAWRLGLAGWPVAWVSGAFSARALSIELATALGSQSESDAAADGISAPMRAFGEQAGVLIVDEPDAAPALIASLRAAGARVVGRRTAAVESTASFLVPPLSRDDATALVRRALTSLPAAVVSRIVERGEGRPGELRAIVEAIGERAIVRAESVDVIAASLRAPRSDVSEQRPSLALARELLEHGRTHDAESVLGKLAAAPGVELLRATAALARSDYDLASTLLGAIDEAKCGAIELAERAMLRARLSVRTSAYDRAIDEATAAIEAEDLEARAPVILAEALQSRGVARVYRGDHVGAHEDLARGRDVARAVGSQRALALIEASFALAYQRAGRTVEARAAYVRAIAAAEAAGDPGALSTIRLNAGVLAWSEGDLAAAIVDFEAAADLARKVGRAATLERALINLAVVDLGLGRHARVRSTLGTLEALASQMTPVPRAQLAALRAELAGRSGDPGADKLYDEAIGQWRTIGRPGDAAEAMIEQVLLRHQRGARASDVEADARQLDLAEKEAGARVSELAASLALARGLVLAAKGDDVRALASLDEAVRAASTQNAGDWRWQAHAARARLLSAQGSVARARRDADEAAAILEEMAQKLPRDLREVFWDEPRRKALRQVHEATQTPPRSMLPPSSLAPLSPHAPPPTLAAVAGPAGTMLSAGTSQFARLAEDRLARILEVNRDLACEPDLGRLLARVTDHAIELLGADRGFVLLEGEEDTASTPGAEGLTPHAARDRRSDDPSVSFSRSIAERVLRTAEPIVTNNPAADARIGDAKSVHALSLQAVACVPIPRVRGGDRRPIGVLYLESRGPRLGRTAMDAELPTLVAFADQVGIAIANARLVEENRRRADELARANEQLSVAKERLDELLTRRTEQLTRAKADLGVARQALRGHAGYAGYQGLVGTSAAMRKLYALIDRVKVATVPVLITGESGTGKEVVARAIHAGSERGKRAFLGVNCGAIPGNLLESELFGHVRGAFTGADRERKGLFREAEGGTLLLDEIGEMPLKMQAGLLRVLQEKTVRPVGGNREEEVDARVICATNRDLSEMVAAGTFREDLFYRINVVAIRLPALRERAEDVPLLVDHFMGVFAAHYRRERKTVSREAMKLLAAYAWPGNVRQLEHVLLNAFVLSESNLLEPADFSLPEQRHSTPAPAPAANLKAHKLTERERILGALEKANWNRLQAAKLCGIPRRTFYRRLKEYGIQE